MRILRIASFLAVAFTAAASRPHQAATEPIYQRLAAHYRGAIQAGSLVVGDRMPSLRSLMRQHEVSLSTAMQLSRQLESERALTHRQKNARYPGMR